jgi:hypothetical protein
MKTHDSVDGKRSPSFFRLEKVRNRCDAESWSTRTEEASKPVREKNQRCRRKSTREEGRSRTLEVRLNRRN